MTENIKTEKKVKDPRLPSRTQSVGEEIANSITHGIGIIFSIVALTLLIVFAAESGDAIRIVSLTIYGVTMLLLFTFSTLYHSFPWPKVKKVFRIFDHSSIFLLIAGTYTPILLVSIKGKWGWWLFGLIWGLAILGILHEIFFIGKFKILPVIFYLAMGWLIVIAFKPLINSVPKGFLVWLFLGGILYTLGVIFYAWKKMKFQHMIWHLFVLGGSITHFFGILFYVTGIKG
jgi:hemolysin III